MKTSMFGRTAVAALLALGMGAAAQAATISWSSFPEAAIPNPVGAESGTVFQNVSGEVRGERASPWANTSVGITPETSVYSAVTRNSSLTYDLGVAFSTVSFVWGSPDSHNLVTFLSEGVVVDTASVAAGTAAGTATIVADGFFDQVIFSATGSSFEFANLEFIDPIPVPAAGLMLVSALGGMAFLRRRQQKNKA